MSDTPDAPETGGDAEFGLVFPFVTVTSKGGPHDDDAYVAGYEMGQLDAALAAKPAEHSVTLRTVSAVQADLIAMHHGYVCAVEPYAPAPEWCIAQFTPTEDPR